MRPFKTLTVQLNVVDNVADFTILTDNTNLESYTFILCNTSFPSRWGQAFPQSCCQDPSSPFSSAQSHNADPKRRSNPFKNSRWMWTVCSSQFCEHLLQSRGLRHITLDEFYHNFSPILVYLLLSDLNVVYVPCIYFSVKNYCIFSPN